MKKKKRVVKKFVDFFLVTNLINFNRWSMHENVGINKISAQATFK